MNTSALYAHFQNYFDLLLANTPELLEQAYRIRYEIYCQEFHYERAEDYPGQRAAYHLTVADFLHSWNQETLRMYHCIHETLEKRAA